MNLQERKKPNTTICISWKNCTAVVHPVNMEPQNLTCGNNDGIKFTAYRDFIHNM